MSDVYEIIEKLSREVCELHSDNQRLRARVEVLEREVERLEQKSEKDWKWFSDATGM